MLGPPGLPLPGHLITNPFVVQAADHAILSAQRPFRYERLGGPSTASCLFVPAHSERPLRPSACGRFVANAGHPPSVELPSGQYRPARSSGGAGRKDCIAPICASPSGCGCTRTLLFRSSTCFVFSRQYRRLQRLRNLRCLAVRPQRYLAPFFLLSASDPTLPIPSPPHPNASHRMPSHPIPSHPAPRCVRGSVVQQGRPASRAATTRMCGFHFQSALDPSTQSRRRQWQMWRVPCRCGIPPPERPPHRSRRRWSPVQRAVLMTACCGTGRAELLSALFSCVAMRLYAPLEGTKGLALSNGVGLLIVDACSLARSEVGHVSRVLCIAVV